MAVSITLSAHSRTSPRCRLRASPRARTVPPAHGSPRVRCRARRAATRSRRQRHWRRPCPAWGPPRRQRRQRPPITLMALFGQQRRIQVLPPQDRTPFRAIGAVILIKDRQLVLHGERTPLRPLRHLRIRHLVHGDRRTPSASTSPLLVNLVLFVLTLRLSKHLHSQCLTQG